MIMDCLAFRARLLRILVARLSFAIQRINETSNWSRPKLFKHSQVLAFARAVFDEARCLRPLMNSMHHQRVGIIHERSVFFAEHLPCLPIEI